MARAAHVGRRSQASGFREFAFFSGMKRLAKLSGRREERNQDEQASGRALRPLKNAGVHDG